MSSVTAAVGQILLKLGAEGRHQLVDFINAFIAGGLLFYGVGTAIWIYVLSSEKLMNVFAFTALTFVLVYVGSMLIDGNGTTGAGLIGILLVLSGLYLLSQHNV
jgi:succinate-acetate transporter protein